MLRITHAAGWVALSLFSLSAPASAVVCVDPGDPGCFATIQAGVDAAAVGEVVVVATGLYIEKVSITTAGVILRGGKGAVIDAEGLGAPEDAITIGAADVAIESLAIRNGDTGITVNGVGGTRISNVSIQSADGPCIELNDTTPGVRIEGSRLQICGDEAVTSELSNGLLLTGNTLESSDGVDVTGADVRAERNSWSRHGDTCLAIVGGDAVVTGNRFDLCASGIAIEGADAVVTRNTLTNTDGTAIDVEGDDFVIEGNPITASGRGIDTFCEFSCGSARIVRNRLATLAGSGIVAESLDGGLTIEGNQLSQAVGGGLVLDTVGANVVGNRVTTAGGSGGECIDLDGSGNLLTRNGLAGCGGDGIKLDGDTNTVEANRVAGTGDDGIDVVADGVGNTLLENQASGATDNGIEVSVDATGTTVTDNQASGLHAAYCDGGTATGGTDVPDDTMDCGDIDD